MLKKQSRTFSAKGHEVERKWLIIDAENQVVGRLASNIATLLRGKHKPIYTPHVDTGDFVVVINAEKVRFTGNKELQKQYFRHTGYPGGGRTTSVAQMRAKKPEQIVQKAVKGMLPHNKLGRSMIGKLKVYAGPDHPHEAQSPEPFTI